MVVVCEQWFSDFGPVILVEAMKLARPVVAGSIGAIPEFIEDKRTGLLAQYNNPEDYTEKINWLLDNKKEAALIGQRARTSVAGLTEESFKKRITEIYRNLANK